MRENLGAGASRTVKRLVALEDTGGGSSVAGLLGLLGRVACNGVNGASYDGFLAGHTADKAGGEGAVGEGAGGHAPCRGDGRALNEHGEGNWVEWRGWAWVSSWQRRIGEGDVGSCESFGSAKRC